MRHLPFRRAIALAIVFCQLVAAMGFHMPMAHAMSGANHAVPASHHCHDAGNTEAASLAGSATHATHANHAGHGSDGTCKSGLCNCACAHASALAVGITPAASSVPHPPMTLVYSVPVMAERPTKFFRPPI